MDCGFESIGLHPAFDEPQWMRTVGSECTGRAAVDRRRSGVNARRKVGNEFPQNGIYEWSGRAFASALDELDTLMDRGARWNTAEPAQLVNGEPKCSNNLGVEFGERLR